MSFPSFHLFSRSVIPKSPSTPLPLSSTPSSISSSSQLLPYQNPAHRLQGQSNGHAGNRYIPPVVTRGIVKRNLMNPRKSSWIAFAHGLLSLVVFVLGVIGSRPSADMYSQIDIQRTEALRRAQASRGAQRTRLNRLVYSERSFYFIIVVVVVVVVCELSDRPAIFHVDS